MKIIILALCMAVTPFFAEAGITISQAKAENMLHNAAKPGENFPIRHSDNSYDLVEKNQLYYFLRNTFKVPPHISESLDCDDFTAMFIGEFTRHLFMKNGAGSGGAAIGELYCYQNISGQYHVAPIVITNHGVYVIDGKGRGVALDVYQRNYTIHRVRL